MDTFWLHGLWRAARPERVSHTSTLWISQKCSNTWKRKARSLVRLRSSHSDYFREQVVWLMLCAGVWLRHTSLAWCHTGSRVPLLVLMWRDGLSDWVAVCDVLLLCWMWERSFQILNHNVSETLGICFTIHFFESVCLKWILLSDYAFVVLICYTTRLLVWGNWLRNVQYMLFNETWSKDMQTLRGYLIKCPSSGVRACRGLWGDGEVAQRQELVG